LQQIFNLFVHRGAPLADWYHTQGHRTKKGDERLFQPGNKSHFDSRWYLTVIRLLKDLEEAAAMRRIMMGFVWFVVLYFGILGASGAIVGSAAGSGAKTFNQGYQAGHAAGQEFGQKYGALILLIALGGAVVGTLTGALPGTKRKVQ
jgi:hypothetical protein